MNIEEYRDYCLAKPGTSEGFPFDEKTLVFKVMGKMYSLTGVEIFQSVNLKCDPSRALELREKFDGVKPGYHMNKRLWNTVMTDGSITDELLIELTDHSYDLVVLGLTKDLKLALEKLH
jgi:predicted DNA-binding protein (MmcQ/YjbR family)